MTPSRVRFAAAQLGTARRGRPLLDALVGPAELSGAGWRVQDERTWRTGHGARPAPWLARARESGSITAWRSLEGPGRWLWVQVTPLGGPDDEPAALAFAADPASALANARAEAVATGARLLDPPPDVAGAGAVSATEEQTGGPRGPGAVLTLRCTAEAHLTVACGSGPGWTWAELSRVVALQLHRTAVRIGRP